MVRCSRPSCRSAPPSPSTPMSPRPGGRSLSFPLFNMIPIDPTNPMALRVLVDELKKGRKVVIFPEGRLTVTGALMKVYEGPGAIAQMAKAKVLPVRIDGAQYTPFSRMRGKLRLRLVSQDHADVPATGEIRSARRHARCGTARASGRQALRRDDRHGLPHLEHRPHAVSGPARCPRHAWRQASGGRGHPAQPGEL